MKETIIQFGTGNFLRGFIDYFIDVLNEKSLYDGKVVVVKPTNCGSLSNFIEQDCVYNLYLRGIENGNEVCEHRTIKSISRVVDSYSEFRDFLALALNPDFKFIVSNTTEAGIVFDEACKFTDSPASSFPAKLTQLLFERYKASLSGFVILPCELIDNNAVELKKCVLKYADIWNLGNDFINWIENENQFCNTLVDRIVTGFPKNEYVSITKEIGYEDKLLDTAEIFHLWVVEGDFENELPLKKAGFNVVWTNDVSPFKKMKVRILNGSHTAIVFPALLMGIETVGDCLKNSLINDFLSTNIDKYILSVLEDNDENKAFADSVTERFRNPYIHHELKAISLNSVSKFSVRVLPTMLDYKAKYGKFPKSMVLSLTALIYYYKKFDVKDDTGIVDFIKNNNLTQILSEKSLWGRDLSELIDLVSDFYDTITDYGIEKAIKNSLL